MQKVFLVVGCPGSGKTWVCEQLTEKFHFVPHDDYLDANGRDYVPALVQAARQATMPVLAEAPFSVSQILDPLDDYGIEVVPVFILEDEAVLKERYHAREGKEIPKGHLTRQRTYESRARELDAFSGTSEEVLQFLELVHSH